MSVFGAITHKSSWIGKNCWFYFFLTSFRLFRWQFFLTKLLMRSWKMEPKKVEHQTSKKGQKIELKLINGKIRKMSKWWIDRNEQQSIIFHLGLDLSCSKTTEKYLCAINIFLIEEKTMGENLNPVHYQEVVGSNISWCYAFILNLYNLSIFCPPPNGLSR